MIKKKCLQQKYIAVLNIHASNNRVSNSMKQNLREQKGRIN